MVECTVLSGRASSTAGSGSALHCWISRRCPGRDRLHSATLSSDESERSGTHLMTVPESALAKPVAHGRSKPRATNFGPSLPLLPTCHHPRYRRLRLLPGTVVVDQDALLANEVAVEVGHDQVVGFLRFGF